ncbi:MAG: N2,N2-dimethylguanosine tRNA methyltransferase, partial [Marteilia pararefringens]
MTTETSGEETSPKAKLCEEAGFEFEVSRGSDFSFYNPSQKINRDLSTLAVCAFVDSLPNTIDNLKIVDCTSATGIRSIRYVKSLLNSVNKKFSSLSVKALDINEKA